MLLRVSALSLAAVLAIACSSANSASTTSAGTGGSPASGEGGQLAFSGSSASGGWAVTGGSATAGSVNTGRHTGNITLDDSRRIQRLDVLLGFPLTSTRSGTPCTSTSYGDCTFSDCSSSTATSVTTYASAGPVTVTSVSPAANIVVQPNADGSYTSIYQFDIIFRGGEAVQVSAAGADVPAFSASVQVPLVLLIDSPVADAQGIYKAASTSDLVINFSRGTADVIISASAQVSARSIYLSCQADSLRGTLTIPAAALAAIGSGETIYFETVSKTTVTAGDWDVNIWTALEAFLPDKTHWFEVEVQ
jgi:hypothetical protein